MLDDRLAAVVGGEEVDSVDDLLADAVLDVERVNGPRGSWLLRGDVLEAQRRTDLGLFCADV